MLRIRIQPSGALLYSEGRARLIDLIDDTEGTGMPLSCRGARCGICRVRVARGGTSLADAAPDECETLAALGASADERLACQIWLRDAATGEVVLELNPARAAEE